MNTEKYKEVLFKEGTDLDEAIELLQKEKELGNNAYLLSSSTQFI